MPNNPVSKQVIQRWEVLDARVPPMARVYRLQVSVSGDRASIERCELKGKMVRVIELPIEQLDTAKQEAKLHVEHLEMQSCVVRECN